MDATKPQIKAAVEMLSNVKVTAVNTFKGEKVISCPGWRSIEKSNGDIGRGQNIDLMGV